MTTPDTSWESTDAQSEERGQLSRREALTFMGSTFVAGMSGLFNQSKTTAADVTMDTVNDRRKAVEAMGTGKRMTLDYDPEQEGKLLLAPGVVRPDALVTEPVRIAKTFYGRGGPINTDIFIEIPMNLGYQRNLGTDFYLVIDGKPLDPSDFEAEIIYNEPCKQNPHKFPVAKFSLNHRAQRATVVTDSWLLRPGYDTQSQLHAELLRQTGGNRLLAQQAYNEMKHYMARNGYADKSDQEIYDAAFIYNKLRDPQFAAVAQKIVSALNIASALPYNSGSKKLTPREVSNARNGDCGVKAARAKQAAVIGNRNLLEFIEGYKITPTDRFGGRHATNYALLPDNTSFTADADSRGKWLVYPTNSRLIVCKAGEFINMPDNTKFPKNFNHTYTGLNDGAYNRNSYKYDSIAVTTVRGGPDVRTLRQMAAQGPDKAVADYGDLHRDQIMSNYVQ